MTLGTFLFLGTFLCLVGDVREFSWLVFSLPFLPCVISLAKSSLALKVGFSGRRKRPRVSFRVLRNMVAFPCCSFAVTKL